ncbi:MAG: hypothetical protein AB1668_07210 [Nanoarchaeota archaeon]
MKRRTKKPLTGADNGANKFPLVSFVCLGAGGVVILLSLFLVLDFFNNFGISEIDATGASTYHYYGVSGYPMPSQAGNMQTYVVLTQPELGGLVDKEKRAEMAGSIADATNFRKGIVEVYQQSSPEPLMRSTDDIGVAGDAVGANFLVDTYCLKRISENYAHWGELKLAVITSLAYNFCSSDQTKWYAYAKYTYYELIGGNYICSQETGKLFTIEKGTGLVSLDIAGC